MAVSYIPVYGIVQNIQQMPGQCCQQLVTMRTEEGIVRLLVTPDTYVIGSVRLRPGMSVAGFYDGNAPVPLIFPPQYNALIIGQRNPLEEITVNFFDNNLIASDGSLALNPGPSTEVITSNGQQFSCSLANQTLIVYYRTTTRSIPPQTTPRRIIVLCR
jgi:hypothetical protein